MTHTEICARLDGHLQGLPNAPPIIFDNSPAARPAAGVFLEAVNLPAHRQSVDFCGTVRQRGIYSINIFTALHGGGGAAHDCADRIDAHFSRTAIAGVYCDTATLTRIGQVGEYFVFNISVPWRTA